MRELKIITCQPQDPNFWWQVAVQCYNFRKYGLSDKMRVLLYLPHNELDMGFDSHWRMLEVAFPEVKFFYQHDYDNLRRTILSANYPSLVRPYCLEKHFRKFPELEKDAILYVDADVLLMKPLDIEKYLDDDINYLSYTGNRWTNYNYMCYDHFETKEENIRPEKLEMYRNADPLGKLLSSFGLTREFFKQNKDSVGGAQYLLKNVNYKFWQKVFDECVNIRTYLQRVNQSVMKGDTVDERENNGFQSWCADMWAILWTLWGAGLKVECPEEMDFTWATDRIEEWGFYNSLYHDAGTISDEPNNEGNRLFYKRGTRVKAANGDTVWNYALKWEAAELRTPFMDDLSYVSPKYCSYNYVKELKEAQKYLNL